MDDEDAADGRGTDGDVEGRRLADVEGDDRVRVRPYDPARDADGLWTLKRGFETGLGEGTGDEGKADRYAAKLTPAYRERWLAWAARCVDEDEGCLQVAVVDGDRETGTGDAGGNGGGRTDGDEASAGAEGDLVGYGFVLPESLSFVWDAAVLNELFVAPAWRGTGVADALMRAALDHAREQELPLDRMVLDVDRANERARAFYDRYGFEHWGEMVAREL
jgi:ribosomal protein S18 acetylase RimI-like enzyme